jgi:hypothetical protein
MIDVHFMDVKKIKGVFIIYGKLGIIVSASKFSFVQDFYNRYKPQLTFNLNPPTHPDRRIQEASSYFGSNFSNSK